MGRALRCAPRPLLASRSLHFAQSIHLSLSLVSNSLFSSNRIVFRSTLPCLWRRRKEKAASPLGQQDKLFSLSYSHNKTNPFLSFVSSFYQFQLAQRFAQQSRVILEKMSVSPFPTTISASLPTSSPRVYQQADEEFFPSPLKSLSFSSTPAAGQAASQRAPYRLRPPLSVPSLRRRPRPPSRRCLRARASCIVSSYSPSLLYLPLHPPSTPPPPLSCVNKAPRLHPCCGWAAAGTRHTRAINIEAAPQQSNAFLS